MKAWSDEWTNARLRLHLREDQLFQGETINMHILADVLPLSDNIKTPHGKQKGMEAAAQSLQLWKDHCKEARVQIQVVEILENNIHSSSSTSVPSTLLRQETQFLHISMEQPEDKAGPVVKLKTEFDLKIRHDFWNRPVLLTVHITPKNGIVQAVDKSNDSEVFRLGSKELVGDSILRDEWASSQLVSHTRDEVHSMPLMTRRIEQRILVTKPLQLDTESCELPKKRIGILIRASNKHSTLALMVRDLNLHLDLTSRASITGTSNYCIVSGDKVPFPVVLQPQERYNFLFVLERVESMMLDESLEPVDMTPTTSRLKKKAKSSQGHCSVMQRSLLTLSWQAVGVSMDAITESRTIVRSPKAPSASFMSGENEPPIAIKKLAAYVLGRPVQRGGRPDFQCVRLLPDSALQTTIAPLASSISAGSAVTVCVTVVNRSVRTDFDLSLALLPLSESVCDGNNKVAPAAVGFEASHRLGLLRPGMNVRRSLHLVFLRSGVCKMSPLVLVDHLTRTCFVTDEWEVFVRN